MIFLVDCNNFYVSCERIFRPDLKNVPVVVLSNNDGCIISRSNEAKKLGIKMGEPVFKINKFMKENNVRVFSSNFELYGEISNRVMKSLSKFSDDLEIYSIDEAFMSIKYSSDYSIIAKEIISNIKTDVVIPVSVGVSKTKTLAKVASSIAKNIDQNYSILKNELRIFQSLRNLPVHEIWGIGYRYSKFLNKNKIFTGIDLVNRNKKWILGNMNINVLKTTQELRGVECFPIINVPPSKKSITVSRSFREDIFNYLDLERRVNDYAFKSSKKLREEKLRAYTLSVFIVTNRFKNNNKSYYYGFLSENFLAATNNYIDIVSMSNKILKKIFRRNLGYKKAGVILSSLSDISEYQSSYLKLHSKAQDSLMNSIDHINKTFGSNMVKLASQNFHDLSNYSRKKLSKKYMSSWKDLLDINI